MSEETDQNLGVRQIVKKGGSLTITLPKKVIELLGVGDRDELAFIKSANSQVVYLQKQQELVDQTSLLRKSLERAVGLSGRPLSQKEIEEILKGLVQKKE